MNFKRKLFCFFLPSLFVFCLGGVAVKFPDLFKQEGGYVGYGGKYGWFVLFARILLFLFWGKVAGIILIISGMIGLVFSIVKLFKKSEEPIIDKKTKIAQAIISSSLPTILKKDRGYFKKSRQNKT